MVPVAPAKNTTTRTEVRVVRIAMAGWDEGNIFYSDQRYLAEEEEEETYTRNQAKRKFVEFIRSYQDHSEGSDALDVYVYRDQLSRHKNKLYVDLEDVKAFDEDLCELLKRSPVVYLPLFEAAASEVYASFQNKNAEGEEPETQEVQVFLESQTQFGPASLRELSSEHIARLVRISGIVIAASKTKSKATHMTIMCRNCNNTKVIPCSAGFGSTQLPRRCDLLHTENQSERCPLDPFVVLPDRSKYVDMQTLKLQENPEDVPTGEMPRSMMLSIDRHMVQRIVPGTRVTLVGIFSIFQQNNKRGGGAVAIRQPYIRVVGLEEHVEGNARAAPTFTYEEEQEFREFADSPDVLEKVFSKVAPSIYGHSDVKRAVACLLFGGSRKILPDGVRLRGDINVLLLGDPSTAKSQFLKFVEKTAPIAVYTSGKGSSAAGLTASVIRDPQNGEFYLEGGAMVLADGGVVCIDEFDKMRPEDRVAIHEAMEQQTISIAKAGITTVLNSRAAVLAAANPPSGRYDDLQTAKENIDLQSTILSRFDLIFIVKDERNFDRDVQIARHVVGVHQKATEEHGAFDKRRAADESFMKRFIEYARSRCTPRLSEAAARILQDEYVRIRQEIKKSAEQSGGQPPVPITVRQLEAIVRISESLARMSLKSVANEAHVREALRMFRVSTIDAARSGVTEGIVFTPEQRQEMVNVEAQIKRRLPIGSYMSTKNLLREMGRLGLSEPSVRRCLIFLSQQGDVDFRRERRVVYRSH